MILCVFFKKFIACLYQGINVQDFKEQYNLLVRMLNGSGCEVISIEKEHSHSSVSSTIKSINKFIVSKVVKDCVIVSFLSLSLAYSSVDLYRPKDTLIMISKLCENIMLLMICTIHLNLLSYSYLNLSSLKS